MPPDLDLAEYWSYKPGTPPWFIRAAQANLWRTGRDEVKDDCSGTDGSEKERVETDGVAVKIREVVE